MHDWIAVPGGAPESRRTIGGKAEALARLAAVHGPGDARAEVPAWFALRAEAFVALTGVLPDAPEAHAGAIRALACPGDLRRGLELALATLLPGADELAVRSSATAEDGAAASFAGQYASVLGVRADADAVWAAVLAVWASTTRAHAAAYAGAHAGGEPPAMAVIVQQMVVPLAAGVAFDADPVTGARDVVVVSAVPGLGEALVSGETDADTWRLAFENGAWRVRERVIAAKTQVVHARGGQLVREPIDAAHANAPALDDAQATAVAAWTRAVSQVFGAPQDVEWALVGTPPRVVLLQARPITTLRAPADDSPGAPAALEPERRIWDNSNIVESYAGVTTPLTFTFARAVYEDVYRQFCTIMGVPRERVAAHAPVFANMLGLVRGRVYYPLLSWYRTLALLPGFAFNRGFMERMMGVRERLEDPPPPARSADRLRDLAALVAMVARMIGASRALARDVPAFHAHVDGVLAPLASEDLTARTPAELGALYRRLERELLAHWRAPLVNDFFAMLFFGVLCKALERWVPGEPPTLANELLCGEGGIVSTEPARAVMALARDAAADDALRALLAGGASDAELWRALHGTPHEAFGARLDAYVARWGDRCMNELELETITLREDPAFLVHALRTYAAQGSLDPDAALAHERAIRAAAEARVLGALRGPRRWAFRAILAQARRRVRDRENLRFERTRVFGVIRRLFLALGARLAEAGRLASARDVLWLTVEEALAEAEGRPAAGPLAPRVAARQSRFAAWAKAPAPPDRFETHGAVRDWLAHDPPELAAYVAPAAPAAGDLHGLGCCPGVVRARVRVVRDPAGARELAGAILVAERTDPGWTLLFPAVSGLLVQRGSLLSHSAIVAREMGLPCIVGVAGLLETLRDGEIVEMDGTAGTIRRLAAGEAT